MRLIVTLRSGVTEIPLLRDRFVGAVRRCLRDPPRVNLSSRRKATLLPLSPCLQALTSLDKTQSRQLWAICL